MLPVEQQRGISATKEEQAGESRRNLRGSICGGDILWPIFKKATHLQQRYRELQAEEEEESKGTGLCAHVHFIFLRKQLRASQSSQGTECCGDGAGRGRSKDKLSQDRAEAGGYTLDNHSKDGLSWRNI